MTIRLLTLVAFLFVAGCDPVADDADGGADGGCGTAVCTGTQLCLYRECSLADRCRVSSTCLTSETPTTCPNGQAGCLGMACAAVVQGCRDIPASCGGDVTCACGSICGSPAACSKVTGRNGLCAAQ